MSVEVSDQYFMMPNCFAGQYSSIPARLHSVNLTLFLSERYLHLNRNVLKLRASKKDSKLPNDKPYQSHAIFSLNEELLLQGRFPASMALFLEKF